MTEKYSLDELDRLASEKIMGWVLYKDEKDWVRQKCWHPTRDIAQAFMLFDHVNKGYKHTCEWRLLSPGEGSQFTCLIRYGDELRGIAESEASTAPEAIVKACLRAKGVEL